MKLVQLDRFANLTRDGPRPQDECTSNASDLLFARVDAGQRSKTSHKHVLAFWNPGEWGFGWLFGVFIFLESYRRGQRRLLHPRAVLLSESHVLHRTETHSIYYMLRGRFTTAQFNLQVWAESSLTLTGLCAKVNLQCIMGNTHCINIK